MRVRSVTERETVAKRVGMDRRGKLGNRKKSYIIEFIWVESEISAVSWVTERRASGNGSWTDVAGVASAPTR
jgi:hypothetical protein